MSSVDASNPSTRHERVVGVASYTMHVVASEKTTEDEVISRESKPVPEKVSTSPPSWLRSELGLIESITRSTAIYSVPSAIGM